MAGIVFIGKRHYTGKDALEERYGRIFHLPAEWSREGRDVMLWLVDYHGRRAESRRIESLDVVSTPIRGLSLWKQLWRSFAHPRPSVVVASGDCYIGLFGWMLARLVGARFVFDVYDKYDEFAGYMRPLGLDLFGFLLGRADLKLFASLALAERLCPGGESARVAIAANGVDPSVFHTMPRAGCREELGLPARSCLVGYFGAMEPDRGVADLVDAIGRLRQAGRDLGLLVCGREHASTPLDRNWITYRGMVPHDQMPLYLNACDVLAVPYRLSDFMDMGASCKIAEYLACAKPVASTSTPNLMANFPTQAAQLGQAICRPADPADLARAIDYQLQHGVVASLPSAHLWPSIAAAALAAIDGARVDG